MSEPMERMMHEMHASLVAHDVLNHRSDRIHFLCRRVMRMTAGIAHRTDDNEETLVPRPLTATAAVVVVAAAAADYHPVLPDAPAVVAVVDDGSVHPDPRFAGPAVPAVASAAGIRHVSSDRRHKTRG